MDRKRISTGIPELDAHLGGGFPEGKSYLITGGPGTGKSIFCINFVLEGLKAGEKAVYVSVDEKPADVIEQAASLGWDLAQHVDRKELIVLDAAAYFSSRVGAGKEKQVDIQKAVGDLSNYVGRIQASRLVIDPLGPLILLPDSASRAHDQARMLLYLLQSSLQTTNLLTSYATTRLRQGDPHGIEEYLVSGTINLGLTRTDNGLVRTLLVEKMRSTSLELVPHEFTIAREKGIILKARS